MAFGNESSFAVLAQLDFSCFVELPGWSWVAGCSALGCKHSHPLGLPFGGAQWAVGRIQLGCHLPKAASEGWKNPEMAPVSGC